MKHQPKHILICRKAEDSVDLRKALEAKGFVCHFLPVFSVEKTDNRAEIEHTLQDLSRFQWLLLGSARAIPFLSDFLSEFKMRLTDFPRLRIGVVGKKTAHMFQKHFPKKDIQLIENKLQNLLDEISRQAGQEKISALNITSAQSLENISLTVPDNIYLTRLPIYQTLPNSQLSSSEIAKVRTQKWDAIFFGSPTAFDYFCELIGEDFLSKIAVTAVMGKTTEAHLRKKGKPVHIVPASPDAISVAEAFHQYFSENKKTIATERSDFTR